MKTFNKVKGERLMKTFNVIFKSVNGDTEAINGIEAETPGEAIDIASKRAHGLYISVNIAETYNCKTCGAYPPSPNCGECPKYLAEGED